VAPPRRRFEHAACVEQLDLLQLAGAGAGRDEALDPWVKVNKVALEGGQTFEGQRRVGKNAVFVVQLGRDLA
jgi:hypothetical protein